MPNWYGANSIKVSIDRLIEFAWSAPMRDLAAKVGLSDVGLKKVLVSCGVPIPPQGYWNKLNAGRPVPKRPTAAPRSPGASHLVSLDGRFAAVLGSDPSPDPKGPFASTCVPENLEQLRAAEIKAIGRVSVPRDLGQPHSGLDQILNHEERLKAKKTSSQWSWKKGPLFENPFDRRRLRILNALYLGLAKRGVRGSARVEDADIRAEAVVGGTRVGIEIAPCKERKSDTRHHQVSPYAELPALTPIAVRISSGWKRDVGEQWTDDSAGTVETKLSEITAGVIVVGEAGYRLGLRLQAEWEEQRRRDAEAARLRRIAEAEAQRLEDLKRSGQLLREAEEIRVLVERVKAAVLAGEESLSEADLSAWEAWARSYADKIDPVKSGQIRIHLRHPTWPDMSGRPLS